MNTSATTDINTAEATHTDRATTDSRQARHQRGVDVLTRIHGQSVIDLADSLTEISPELGYQTVAWAYGDIYSRPNLSPRDRQLLTLGMLTSQGGEETELRAHIPLALQVGLTPAEIVEAFLHAAVYCGFPRSINATQVAKQIFAERGITTNLENQASA